FHLADRHVQAPQVAGELVLLGDLLGARDHPPLHPRRRGTRHPAEPVRPHRQHLVAARTAAADRQRPAPPPRAAAGPDERGGRGGTPSWSTKGTSWPRLNFSPHLFLPAMCALPCPRLLYWAWSYTTPR